MAIVKHIKSRNANYSAAINYLLFEHDEKTGKKIVDESGNIHTHIVINSVRKTALIIPHICRWIIKDDNRYSMPLNIIVGAIQNAGTIYADQWQYRCSSCPGREARPRLSARSF